MKKRVSKSKCGTFSQQTITIEELLKKRIVLPERPGQPWTDDENRERWKKSESTGHRQAWCKCLYCGLEIIVLTLRTGLEVIEAFQPSHGQDGGIAKKITCPECGQVGKAALLGILHQAGPIFRCNDGRFRLPIVQREPEKTAGGNAGL